MEVEIYRRILSKRVLWHNRFNHGRVYHEELIRGEGAKGDIGEETLNLG